MGAIGRNDRCPCGSGKKFKKCCLLSASGDDIAQMASTEMLKRRVQRADAIHGGKGPIFVQDLKGVRKMSEIILEFARPVLDEVHSFDECKKVIPMTMIAWNLALTDEADIDAKLEALGNDLFPSASDSLVMEFRERMANLIQRKREHFDHVKRLVMDWDMVEMNGRFHLNVVSTLLQDDIDAKDFETKVGKLLESQSIQA